MKNIQEKGLIEELCQWYEYTLQKKLDYVVFVVRRSYILALLLEKMTGKKMEENSTAVFLTDASLILQCRKIAKIYQKTGKFPSILLCDVLLLHGKIFNHLIDEMENRITECLPGFDPQDIRRALADAVQIHVYARTDQETLLYWRYEKNMNYTRKENTKFLHSSSIKISEYIKCSGISNISFIFSRIIRKEQMEDIKKKEELICSKYQNTIQYTSISYVGTKNIKKAVLSLRFVKIKEGEEYLVIPFVFLPNLDANVTIALLNTLQKQIKNTEFQQIMKMLFNIPGKRSFNELLTMLFSNEVLYNFMERNQIKIQTDEIEKSELVKEELQKLSRNYNFDTIYHTYSFLKNLLLHKLFETVDLISIFEYVIPDSFKILKISGDSLQRKSERKEDKIIRQLESYLYERELNEKKINYQLIQMPYYTSLRRSERRVRACCFMLTDICNGNNIEDVGLLISYILQMMDAEILSLSSYAPNNMNVVGYSQFVNVEEMALLLEPLRYYEYIPMLAKIQFECNKWKIDLKNELELFNKNTHIFDNNIIQEFLILIKSLESIGETIDEWNEEIYIEKIQFNNKEEKQSFIKNMINHLNRYESFVLT